jgi:spore germination protein GerM
MDKRQRFVVYILLAIMIVAAVSLIIVKEKNRIASGSRISVYFVGYDHEKQESYLIPLQRGSGKISGLEGKIRFAVENLFKGLTEEEKAAGLTNAVVKDALLLSIRVEGDTVYLDFSKEIEQGGGTEMMTDRLAQIVFTATQFEPVMKVRMLIEGKFIKYFSGEGLTDVEHPMSRDNFDYDIRQ